MSKSFFPKLAADNIKKNGKTYLPYMITCIMTVAIFYILKSLSLNPGLEKMAGTQILTYSLFLGSWIVAIFSFIFLFYTNSFLIKRRKKEFGVFNILGMEKRHLAVTLAWESLFVGLISLAGGFVVGMALDKLMYLLILKVLNTDISLGFFVSWKAIVSTIGLFAVIFLLIYLNSLHSINVSNPIDLLRDGKVGEKEPKTKWLIALAGAACLGIGYYIAITTESPLKSITNFFVAVLFVIAGTYMLFTAGSIALLKTLKKNKKYYYNKKHFTSVSGMIYRMKQNAVGLANICILSTMVLVIISSTGSLMAGMEDIITTRYPKDFVVYSDEKTGEENQQFLNEIKSLQKAKGLNVKDELEYTYLCFSSIEKGDTFDVTNNGSLMDVDDITNLMFVSLSDYNKAMGAGETLGNNEILIYSNRDSFDYDVLKVFDKQYKVKKTLSEFMGNGLISAVAADTNFIVVNDTAEITDLYNKQKNALGDMASNIKCLYGFDTDADDEEQKSFYGDLSDMIEEEGFKCTAECRYDARTSFMASYGSFFFLGIFLGLLFAMATVLIIYYKQISEGYDDRERFQIMQKVGMSHKEVKSSISSQVLTVFFLPLIVAGFHVAAAFPLISKILEVLNMTNTGLYVACTGGCFLVFAVLYVIVYALTAKTYYKIVSR